MRYLAQPRKLVFAMVREIGSVVFRTILRAWGKPAVKLMYQRYLGERSNGTLHQKRLDT